MATRRQELAIQGELLVVEACRCMRCGGAFRPLRRSTPCAAVRCIECAAPAQVRTRRWAVGAALPRKLMGGAWAPQASLLLGDALHDLFIVFVGDRASERAVYALPGAVQDARLFRRRDLLAPEHRAAGHQAFSYELEPFWPLFRKIETSRAGSRRDKVVHAFPSAAQRERRKQAVSMPPRSAQAVAFTGRGGAGAGGNVVPLGR